MVKNSSKRLLFTIVLLFGILLLSFNLRFKLVTFNEEYNVFVKRIHTIDYNWNKHINEIRSSIIFMNYNNDKIVNILKRNLSYLEKFQKADNYPKTNLLIKKYLNEYNKSIEKTYDFMMSNARVKNSLSNLNRKIKNLDRNRDIEYSHKLVEIVSSFMIMKNSFDIKNSSTKSLYDYFKNYKGNKQKDFHLNFLHIDMLYNEIPKLKQMYNDLLSSNLNELNKQILSSLDKESEILKNDIQFKFYLIIITYILSLLVVIYLIEKSKRDALSILSLQKEKENQLRYDSLTGLLNRTSFVIDSKEGNNVVLVIDIIEFNKINSLIGYEGGDIILKEVSTFLKQSFEKVYRVGIDHFAIILENKTLDDSVKIASNILHELDTHAFVYNKLEIPLRTNIGISDKRLYLKNAEIAIWKNKEKFKRICIYDESMNEKEEVQKRFQMLAKVKKAIKNDNIKPFFQPIVDSKTKKIVKYEALVRLIDEGNVISPYYFLDISKRSKLYPEITKIVIKRSIEIIKERKIEISINLSYLDITDQTTLNYILILLQNNKDIAKYITFEILESEEIDNYDLFFTFAKKIKKHGCHLAIDDFGSGYSNFTQLFNIMPDIVKIDGSLIKEIHTNNHSKDIVEAIVNLASKANIKTVAEYVDNPEVDKIVEEMNIDYAQGFYYSEPKDLF